MALNRSDKSRILRRYFPGMTRNSEMSTEPSHRANQPANASAYLARTQNGRQTVPGAALRFVSHWPVLETACTKLY